MHKIKHTLIFVMLLIFSKVYGQPSQTVKYTLDELGTNTQFIHDLDSIMRIIYWDDSINWEYCTVWIKDKGDGEYFISATLSLPPLPPSPNKNYSGYIEHNGLIYIIALKSNPDNMFFKKTYGRGKNIITKIYKKGELPPPSDPPEWFLIMDQDHRLRAY